MSVDSNETAFSFHSTPHDPRPQCNANLRELVWIESIKDSIEVRIPCDRTVHKITTRHRYVGTTANGATVEMFWRDEPDKA